MTDKELIAQFITRLYEWLEACLNGEQQKHPWPFISPRPELRDFAVAAWNEFKKDFPKQRLINASAENYSSMRKNHGLYGKQLAYKLRIIELASEDGKEGKPGWKRKLLDVIDNLLESVGDGLPGFGALKELKDSLLIGVD